MMRSRLENFTELGQFDLDPASIRLLPLRFCRESKVVILSRVLRGNDDLVLLGMLNPQDTALQQEVERRINRAIRPIQLNTYEIEKALHVAYGQPEPSDNVIPWSDAEPRADATIPQMINHVLADAVYKGASDIHLESYQGDVDLRLRIDGILHQVFTHITPDNVQEVISRIKVMADLDITERRKPLDGRFRATILFQDKRRTIDFRVSVVPSPAGEDVVLRVLDSGHGLIPIEQLGMPTAMQVVFLRLLANPEGLILVTGPTGSGKTTTLYSALSHMRDGHRKIMTAEDPIEYYIDKINQKQVSPGMSMASLSRALLRQDPDVMLFGEIRDHEMGNMALMAAETGHVVLSTLHTSDAVGAVVRLRGLGLENADIANSLLGAVGQRLMRRICKHCIEPTLPNDAQAAMLGELLDNLQFFEGRGCNRCFHTGYRGRVGIYELLLLDEGLQDMIADGAHKSVLRRYVMGNGFRTLVDDALSKVNAGLTTIDELLRVLPYRQLILARQDRLRYTAAPHAPSPQPPAAPPSPTLPTPAPPAHVFTAQDEQPDPDLPRYEPMTERAEPHHDDLHTAPHSPPNVPLREMPEASLDIQIDVDKDGSIHSFGYGSGLQIEHDTQEPPALSGQDMLSWIDPHRERAASSHQEKALDLRSTAEIDALQPGDDSDADRDDEP
jgi:type II secretory ATPase GspE/PulE/Tfp pilus assembly ATPase PilB-like protein